MTLFDKALDIVIVYCQGRFMKLPVSVALPANIWCTCYMSNWAYEMLFLVLQQYCRSNPDSLLQLHLLQSLQVQE